MYTAPQATALLKGSIFICLQGEGRRVNIQNYGYCITVTLVTVLSLIINIRNLNCLMQMYFVNKCYK